MSLDLSNRKTYTSDSASYSIQYPRQWRVNESGPANVTFTSPTNLGKLAVTVRTDIPESYTLKQATADYLRQQGGEQKNQSVTIRNRRNVTLPNGHSAVLLDLRITSASFSVSIRENAIITVANNTVYSAGIALVQPAYTPTVVHQINEMLTSLAIRGGTTSGKAHTETNLTTTGAVSSLAG